MKRRTAFTLVELLIVIGIIALLISILLPTINAAREQANKTKCSSNLKQLGTAWTGYLNESRGVLPAPSQGLKTRISKRDWFYWQPGRDPNESPIAPYLSKPLKLDVFRCPSDNVEQHKKDDGSGPYRYSYAMNIFLSNPHEIPPSEPPINPAFVRNLKISNVVRSSEKILFIEEEERTINDGAWAAKQVTGKAPTFPSVDRLASRHEKRKKSIADKEARGNAAFADGHVEYITRGYAQDDRYILPFK